MASSPQDHQSPERTAENQLVEAIRADMMEMTAAVTAIEVDAIEVELPYRAAWTGTEAAR